MAYDASTCLTLEEIEYEMREVTAADWFPLGVQLGIRPAKLREIEKDHPGDVWRCKFELMDWWHRNAKDVSWKALAHALEKTGRYGTLAEKLRRKMSAKENQERKLPSNSDLSGGQSQKDAPGHGRAVEVKVFILSPHNPKEYVHILPPDELRQHPEQHPELLRKYKLEVEESEARMEEEINKHQGLMTRFAHCLEARGITVTGVHQLRDSAVSNIVQWADGRIKNSNFVILIITPSFSKFLEKHPPPDKECLFGATGDYVSLLLNYPPDGVTFLPVFLYRFEDMHRLPVTLQGRQLYEIFEPFEHSLEKLYNVLTKTAKTNH